MSEAAKIVQEIPEPSIKSVPDSEGWWARYASGRIQWFQVREISEFGLSVYIEEMEDFVRIDSVNKPSIKWYGPIILPSVVGRWVYD